MKLHFVRRGALLLVLALACPILLVAQAPTGTISGRVTDASVGRGLPDVQITVTGTRIGALTGPNGEYTLTGVPTGPRTDHGATHWVPTRNSSGAGRSRRHDDGRRSSRRQRDQPERSGRYGHGYSYREA